MFEQLVKTIILGIIQGLAEWLPISSTAHLKIAQQLLAFPATPLFDVALHVGTLFVVIFYFRKDVMNILVALAHFEFKSEYGHLIPLIVVATIPTGIIGLTYAKFLEPYFTANTFVMFLAIGIAFIIGATWLYISKMGKENTDVITVSIALLMGTAQGLASFAGLSRSGMTISTALLLGLKREKAFRFSFLLSIPAVIGDLIVEAYLQRGQLALTTIGPIELTAGMVLAAIVGYIAIRLVSNLVRTKRFHYFAFYTLPLGIALIALTLHSF
ncbi:MAG: undecaprenyl-diphosphate phosphatase [Candidatus Bathyarchaeia archaeon]|jgi:undecaprenyl-diphosphatase